MATNEKVVYAVDWTTYGGRLYKPGEQLTGRMPDHAVRGAQEAGLTGDHAAAERAKAREADRQADVNRQIAERSEKRDFNPREDRR
jgi:hypothetical protein